MEQKEMKVTNGAYIIERIYRDSDPLQFLRELITNSKEAGATMIEVGPDHHTGETQGIWRLMVRDNGIGMSAEQLEVYLNTLSEGGKNIGGVHENFGIGSKTSLLPWNRAGVVVISYTKESQRGNMIKLYYREDTETYGLARMPNRKFVCPPYKSDEIDFTKLRPDWMKTGTIFLMMGNTGYESTYLEVCASRHRPAREHKSIWWALEYTAKRYWHIDPKVKLKVFTFNSKPSPQHRGKIKGDPRRVKGGHHYAEEFAVAKGCLTMPDQTKVWWYLKDKEKDVDTPHAGIRRGGVAALYKSELYNLTEDGRSMRPFGLMGKTSRRTILIFEPKPYKDGFGVYPDSERRSLMMQSENGDSIDLPWQEWADYWRANMPQEIQDSMAEDIKPRDSSHKAEMLERFNVKFGHRYSRRVSYLSSKGDEEVNAKADERKLKDAGVRKAKRSKEAKEARQLTLIKMGERRRRVSKVDFKSTFPDVEWIEEGWREETGCSLHTAATYAPPSASYPGGLVLLNWEHHIFVEVYQHWCSKYSDQAHIQTDIKNKIQQVYDWHITATVLHVHAFEDLYDCKMMLSDASLTCSLMGIYAQEDEIGRALAAHRMKPERSSA